MSANMAMAHEQDGPAPAEVDESPASPPVSVVDRVGEVVSPLLEAQGYDLVLVEYVGSILRLYIDLLDPAGADEGGEADRDGLPPGVGIDDCTKVSRWVSDVLDAEGLSDVIPGRYNLEVSSPGLDRPLARPKDFIRFAGREAKITLHAHDAQGFGGRRRFRGRIASAQETGIEFEVDGQLLHFGYAMIEQARLVPEF